MTPHQLAMLCCSLAAYRLVKVHRPVQPQKGTLKVRQALLQGVLSCTDHLPESQCLLRRAGTYCSANQMTSHYKLAVVMPAQACFKLLDDFSMQHGIPNC